MLVLKSLYWLLICLIIMFEVALLPLDFGNHPTEWAL